MNSMRATTKLTNRPGVTLIEAVIAVVVLAIAVPPTLSMLMDASAVRADAVAATRATSYAQAVMEQVLADACSSDASLGFDAFADGGAYAAGLTSRLAAVMAAYTPFGMTHEVVMSPLTAASGVSTGDPTLDVYRVVTVNVHFTDATGSSTLTIQHFLSELSL